MYKSSDYTYSTPTRRVKNTSSRSQKTYTNDDWTNSDRYYYPTYNDYYKSNYGDNTNIFVRGISWITRILRSILSALIFLPKTLIGYVIWILTYPIILPVYAVKNILLLPINLFKNAVLIVYKIVTWPIGEIGSISHDLWSGLKSIFWRILGYKAPPIDKNRAKMYAQTRGRAKHIETIEGKEYVIKPYEIEYGKNVGVFFKLMYYLKWTFYTLLWVVTFGFIKRAPSFATPYPAIYRRIITKIKVDEEPIQPHSRNIAEEAKFALSSILPKDLENFWWLPLLFLLLLIPTLYVGRGIHKDYKNETDTGIVHNPIEYIASKLSSEAHFIPKSIRNFPLFSGIKNGFEIIYSILDIGWKSIELVCLKIANFLGSIVEKYTPWLVRPVNYALRFSWWTLNYGLDKGKSLLWWTLGLPKMVMTYVYNYIISPLNGLFSGILNGFIDGFKNGFYKPKLGVKSESKETQHTQPNRELPYKETETLTFPTNDVLMNKLRAIVDTALEREKIEIEDKIQAAISEYIGTIKNDVDLEAENLRKNYRQQLDYLQKEKATRYNELIEEQMNTFTKSTIPETHIHTHTLPQEEVIQTHELKRGREMGESMITDPDLINVEKELEKKMETIALSITQQMNEQHSKFLTELRELKRIQQEALLKKNARAAGA